VCSIRVAEDGHFCSRCWADLSLINDPCCKTCGLPFDYEVDEDMQCGGCLHKPPAFDQARSIFQYEAKGRALILALKNNRSFVGFSAISKLMVASHAKFDHVDLIVPVPLHPLRLLKRRFNQSSLIADAYALILMRNNKEAYVDNTLIKRTKNTISQGKLNKEKRYQNVRKAFEVMPNSAAKIDGKTILLIDDVYTTGATLNACATTLKAAGAKKVYALTLSRVVNINMY
jgi:ComF family protein